METAAGSFPQLTLFIEAGSRLLQMSSCKNALKELQGMEADTQSDVVAAKCKETARKLSTATVSSGQVPALEDVEFWDSLEPDEVAKWFVLAKEQLAKCVRSMGSETQAWLGKHKVDKVDCDLASKLVQAQNTLQEIWQRKAVLDEEKTEEQELSEDTITWLSQQPVLEI